MSIIAIENTTIQDDYVTVDAMVEDAQILYHATHLDPEEYCPGLCRASFYLDPEESLPLTEDEFCIYLDSLSLDWELINVGND